MPERAGGEFAARLRALGLAIARVGRAGGLALAVGWAALIWFASSQPARTIGVGTPAGSWLGNLAHAPEFGMLALLASLALPRVERWPDLTPRRRGLVFLLVLAYAAVDELHQAATPDRDPSVLDLGTDLLGAWLTLRVIAAVGGPHAEPERVPGLFVRGLAACVAWSALVTFLPAAFPEQAWL